jgi:hypothetical protein
LSFFQAFNLVNWGIRLVALLFFFVVAIVFLRSVTLPTGNYSLAILTAGAQVPQLADVESEISLLKKVRVMRANACHEIVSKYTFKGRFAEGKAG